MTKILDDYLRDNDIYSALKYCLTDNQPHLGLLLAKIFQQDSYSSEFYNLYIDLSNAVDNLTRDGVSINEGESIAPTSLYCLETLDTKCTRVKLLCNWTDSKSLCDLWNKMSQGGYRWNNIQIVWEEPADYYVVINCPPFNTSPPPDRTIVFRMEPNMENNPYMWGGWSEPDSSYLFVGYHSKHHNNCEWHLSKTYNQLLDIPINKTRVLSAVLSDKYKDYGHIKRIDFAKFLETKGFSIHVFGGNKFNWKEYKGELPPYEKDNGLFPYKYTLAVENHKIPGYFTEKLIDGILSECLTFYHGCPNIKQFVDERAFVWLELSNYEEDYKKISDAIAGNLWEERLPYIRKAKHEILTKLQFFPRLEAILTQVK
jgi:hypothetical protein